MESYIRHSLNRNNMPVFSNLFPQAVKPIAQTHAQTTAKTILGNKTFAQLREKAAILSKFPHGKRKPARPDFLSVFIKLCFTLGLFRYATENIGYISTAVKDMHNDHFFFFVIRGIKNYVIVDRQFS